MDYNIPTIGVADAVQRIVEAYYADAPIMLHGSPGIGKSQAFHQAAKRIAEIMGQPCDVIDLRLMMYDPVEVKGIQTIPTEGDQTRQLRPDYWPKPGTLCLIVCEEIVSALPATQAAAYQLVLDRAVGNHKLTKGQLPVGTGNLLSDRAVVNPIPTPLRDRFGHYRIEPKASDWVDWAISVNLLPEITSFIHRQPHMLFTMEEGKDQLAFATPRSYEKLARVYAIQADMDKKTRRQWAEAFLGKRVGIELIAHMDLLKELPDPLMVLRSPESAPIVGKDNPGLGFALAQSLAYYAARENMGALVTYARRCPPETAICMVKDAGRRKPALKETQQYIAFIAEFDPSN